MPENERILKVKGASLDDHIKCQELSTQQGLLIKYVFDCFDKNILVDQDKILELINSKKLNDKTLFEISLFEKNVIEPKFTTQEILTMSEKFPEFVNSVANFSLGITEL